jgi:hypothetical protein
MRVPRLRLAAVALVSGIALSGCAYDMYGDPYGYGGYGGYGYGYPQSGVSIGIGYGGYGGYGYPYGGYGYGGYGYPYGGYDPFGWYGDYYYPGTGIYVYDRNRTRHTWTAEQRRYWEQRRQQWHDHHSTSTGTTTTGENWSGWDRSHWRDRNAGTTTTTSTDGNWSRGQGNWRRGDWQGRSSVTTSGERAPRAERDRPSHHSREGENERPD